MHRCGNKGYRKKSNSLVKNHQDAKLKKIKEEYYTIIIITYIIHTFSSVPRLLCLSFLKCEGVSPVNFLN